MPAEAYTFDLQVRRGPPKLGGPMLGAGGSGAFDPSNPLFNLGSFGMHGATPGMAALASMGIPGVGGVGGGAGANQGLKTLPPSVPRRATIDTAQLASSALQQSARAAATPSPHFNNGYNSAAAAAGTSPETLESLKRSFERYDAVLDRRTTKAEPTDASGNAAAAAAAGAKAEPVAAVAATPHAKLLSTLQPSLSRGGVDALSERQQQLKKESSMAGGGVKVEGGGGSGAPSAAPSRSSSMFARPLSSMSRSSSLLASGNAAAAAFDPLLAAYARVPPSDPTRVARLPDEPAAAGASPDPRPLVAWDGTRASAYISDSRSFLAQYRAVCSTWQRNHRNTFREMEVHRKLSAAAVKANAPLHSLAAVASAF